MTVVLCMYNIWMGRKMATLLNVVTQDGVISLLKYNESLSKHLALIIKYFRNNQTATNLARKIC